MQEQKRPVKVCRVADREFRIYREFDEQIQAYYLTYPDLKETPLYTNEGRPITRSDYEGCLFYKAISPDDSFNECGDCTFFYREETPADILGICMDDVLRRKKNEKNTVVKPML